MKVFQSFSAAELRNLQINDFNSKIMFEPV